MLRTSLILLLSLSVPVVAQTTPTGPRIDMNAAGNGTPGSNGEGTASVSGSIILPAGWTLSIHTLTIRYAKDGGSSSLNAFAPVKGALSFSASTILKSGNYKVWAVIDVKDADGRERQISSDPSNITVQ
jgi:hypothetical protein